MQERSTSLLPTINRKLTSIIETFKRKYFSPEGGKIKKTLSQWILPIFLLLWIIVLSIASPVFLTWRNVFNVARQIAVIGILSMAQLICVLTGNMDLSIGSFVGLFGILIAGLSINYGFPTALIISLIFALFWGLINGFLVTRGNGMSVIVTLSTMYIARGITLILSQGHPIVNFPMPFEFLGAGNIGPVPYNLIVFVTISIILFIILNYSALGRHIYATGGNKQAANVCGIKTKLMIMGVYINSSLLAAIASIILLGRVASAQPTAGSGMEMDSIATVLIGGASASGGYGGVVRTIMGIFMLGLINNGLNLLGISGYWQFVLKGVIILVAVMVDLIQQRK